MRTHFTNLKLIILALLFSLTGLKAQTYPFDTTGYHVQNWSCGIDSSFWKLINLNPDLTNARFAYDTTVLAKTSGTITPTSYTIPVVFHVISTTTNTAVLSYEQIKWQVAALNAAYENQMVTFRGGTVGSYTANAQIVFVLACNAEPLNGTGYNPTTGAPNGWTSVTEPGVVRYATTNPAILNQQAPSAVPTYSTMLAMTNPSGYFPKTDYLNIYCVPTIGAVGGGTVIGYGTFPWMTGLDGIVFRLDCIGNNSYPTNFPMLAQLNKGTVMAHEAGHYLGLYHTFESITGGSITSAGGPSGCYGTTGTYGTYTTSAYTDGDMIYDTPPTKVTSDLGSILQINTCFENYESYQAYTWVSGNTALDQNDQLENFMCYSDDDKLNTFTTMQCARMSVPLSTGGVRANLTSPSNLTARGVGLCQNYTGIVTGVFNYNLAPGSSCTNLIMQFTNPANPTSNDFNSPPVTTYSWTFGDGTGATGINPTHTYTAQSNYTVTCVATNTTSGVVNSYSTAVTTKFNVHIVGQSSVQSGAIGCLTCPPQITSATVCRGAEQTIFIWFDTGVPNAQITDGTYTTTINNYMNQGAPEIIPYFFTANNTATYSISPAYCNSTFNGSATFNVIDCCPNSVINGDFESTYTTTPTYGFNTDLYNGVLTSGYGTYSVTPLVPTGPWMGWLAGNMQNNSTGKMMIIDCFEGNNTIVNIPPGSFVPPTPSPSPRIWQETLTGLLPNTPYFFSFKILENYNNNAFYNSNPVGPLVFETSIASNTVTLLPPQTFTPTVDNYTIPLKMDWVVYTYTFTTPPNITTSNSFSVTINQVQDFWGIYYDTFLDNINLNQMTPGLQAIGNATICPTGTVQLNVQNNCANPANYNFIWTPSSTLTNSVIANPVANPTTTTVYTLTAVPTNTLGGVIPSYVTTVTVTVLPSVLSIPVVNIAGTTTLCPGGAASTTLTATGISSYYWQPGGISTNPAVFTPTVTTTYTVTGSDGGCKNVGTQTVTVVVSTTPTTISVTPSSTLVCNSNTATTLSASGASTYTWFPVYDISGSNTSASVSASPSSSTTFTVWGTNNGCVGTNTASVVVIAAPVLTFSASPSFSICTGQTATVTASGASTYTWSPSGATTNSIVVTPSGTTTYWLTGGNGTCTTTNLVTVNVFSYPTLTVTASPTVICVGQQVNLAAGTANTYSWSPATSVINPNNASTIAMPYSSTIYTLTGSNYGCNATQTVAITVQTNSCTGTQPASYNLTTTHTYTVTPVLLSANMNLLINTGANVTFSNEEIRIAPNTTITIAPTATLNISGSWLHACASCQNSMWQGIVIENGGVLNVNNSYIEDALQAVYTQTNSSSTPIPTYSITNSILNNNIYGVFVDAHQGNLSGNIIYNTVFTSRALSSHTTANIPTAKSNIAAATPLIPSTSNPIDLPLGGATQAGIYVNAVNPTYPINVGNSAQSYNLFDNLRFGVRAQASSLTVKNNYFQNNLGSSGAYLYGAGVYLDASVRVGGLRSFLSAVSTTLTVGNGSTSINNAEKNYFKNNLWGVGTYRVLSGYINNNNFSNETTSTTYTGTATSTNQGQYAVYQSQYAWNAGTGNTENFQFANNNVQNCATGLWLDFGKVYNTGIDAYLITTNTITATTSTLSTTFANVGMYFQQGGIPNGAVSGVQLNTFEILSNTITNMTQNCIYANSVNNATSTGFFDIQQNTELSVLANTYTAVQHPQPNAAVLFTNCWSSRCSDNSFIHTATYTGTVIPHNQFVAGVYVSQSPKTSVNCNTIKNIGECFVWESTSPSYTLNSSSFQRNSSDYSMYGLVLRNTGVMGDQGSTTHPINDIWGASGSTHWYTGAQTLSDGSFPATSPYSRLYLASPSSCTWTPCSNTYTNAGTPYTSSTSLLSASGTNNLICVSDGGGGGGGDRLQMQPSDSLAIQDSLAALYTSMLSGNAVLPKYDYETRWAMHHHIHSMMPNITVNTNGYGNAKALAAVDVKLAEGNYSLAQSLLNSVTPTNTLEQNFYTVYSILINMQTTDLAPGDIEDLQAIANQCHLTGGSIVWKARAILNNYFQAILQYPDACSDNNIQNRYANNVNQLANTSISNAFDAYVYPNPNTGTDIFIAPVGLTTGSLQIRMTDLEGRTVYENNCAINDGLSNIKMSEIKNGVYFISITNTVTRERVVKKLVIQY